ncbi:MAG: hypothetical protein ABH885_02870 [Candidatus Omnitrophota bacterium]
MEQVASRADERMKRILAEKAGKKEELTGFKKAIRAIGAYTLSVLMIGAGLAGIGSGVWAIFMAPSAYYLIPAIPGIALSLIVIEKSPRFGGYITTVLYNTLFNMRSVVPGVFGVIGLGAVAGTFFVGASLNTIIAVSAIAVTVLISAIITSMQFRRLSKRARSAVERKGPDYFMSPGLRKRVRGLQTVRGVDKDELLYLSVALRSVVTEFRRSMDRHEDRYNLAMDILDRRAGESRTKFLIRLVMNMRKHRPPSKDKYTTAEAGLFISRSLLSGMNAADVGRFSRTILECLTEMDLVSTPVAESAARMAKPESLTKLVSMSAMFPILLPIFAWASNTYANEIDMYELEETYGARFAEVEETGAPSTGLETLVGNMEGEVDRYFEAKKRGEAVSSGMAQPAMPHTPSLSVLDNGGFADYLYEKFFGLKTVTANKMRRYREITRRRDDLVKRREEEGESEELKAKIDFYESLVMITKTEINVLMEATRSGMTLSERNNLDKEIERLTAEISAFKARMAELTDAERAELDAKEKKLKEKEKRFREIRIVEERLEYLRLQYKELELKNKIEEAKAANEATVSLDRELENVRDMMAASRLRSEDVEAASAIESMRDDREAFEAMSEVPVNEATDRETILKLQRLLEMGGYYTADDMKQLKEEEHLEQAIAAERNKAVKKQYQEQLDEIKEREPIYHSSRSRSSSPADGRDKGCSMDARCTRRYRCYSSGYD